jgi:hypothetical protein
VLDVILDGLVVVLHTNDTFLPESVLACECKTPRETYDIKDSP